MNESEKQEVRNKLAELDLRARNIDFRDKVPIVVPAAFATLVWGGLAYAMWRHGGWREGAPIFLAFVFLMLCLVRLVRRHD